MTKRLFLIGFAVLLALIPLVPAIPPFWITLLDNAGLAALTVIGLSLLTGVGGLTSFGQAAFCGFGAYTTAVLTTQWGWSPWLTLPAALLAAGSAAVLLGAITVRLSGHFLPLGTIAWGISLYYLFGKIDILGRHDGISGVPALAIGQWQMLAPGTIYYVIWGFVLLAAIATANLLDSRMGRAIRALRKGKVVAEAFGIDAARVKLIVFVYAALLAGLSGWLYAHFQRAVNPTPFGLHAGIEYLFMAVLGGGGHIWGAILGAGSVVLLKDALQRALPFLASGQAQLETILFGLLLVMLLQIARDGLWPHLMARLPPLPVRSVKRQAGALERRFSHRQAGSPLLQLEAVGKQFGGLMAVNDVGFEVKAGEIVALIGPNGAGKSTIFNLITGVLPVSMGKISFNGQIVSQSSPQFIARAGIARTFQHVKLVADMSVLENVALGAHVRGHAGVLASLARLDRADEEKLLAEAARQIERVGLGEHMYKPAGSLALGQQRIVEIARALCLDPTLLLLDEPAAGLRHFEKQALGDLLGQLRLEGMSVLLVEHDIGFVMGLADRIVALDFGTRIAEGKPEEIKVHPAVLEAYLGGAV